MKDRHLVRPDDLSALMRSARRGDDEAYRRLLGRVAVWLRSVARRGLVRAGRGMEDSEDIVQETLLAMHLKRDSWDETQPLEPWLRAIARHKLVDHLRRRGFRDHVDIDDYADIAGYAEAGEAGSSADARQMLSEPARSASARSSRRSRSRAAARAMSASGWA